MKEVRKRLARYSCLRHYEPTEGGRGNRPPLSLLAWVKVLETERE